MHDASHVSHDRDGCATSAVLPAAQFDRPSSGHREGCADLCMRFNCFADLRGISQSNPGWVVASHGASLPSEAGTRHLLPASGALAAGARQLPAAEPATADTARGQPCALPCAGSGDAGSVIEMMVLAQHLHTTRPLQRGASGHAIVQSGAKGHRRRPPDIRDRPVALRCSGSRWRRPASRRWISCLLAALGSGLQGSNKCDVAAPTCEHDGSTVGRHTGLQTSSVAHQQRCSCTARRCVRSRQDSVAAAQPMLSDAGACVSAVSYCAARRGLRSLLKSLWQDRRHWPQRRRADPLSDIKCDGPPESGVVHEMHGLNVRGHDRVRRESSCRSNRLRHLFIGPRFGTLFGCLPWSR